MNITSNPDVSIIIPIYNGSQWIESCFESILAQSGINKIKIEICVCNDSSNDNTEDILTKYKSRFIDASLDLKIYKNETGAPKGVGYAKNKAVSISSGTYLCFQDIDDVMLPERIQMQFDAARNLPENTLIGSRFVRTPENSTRRYTNWANNLTEEELNIQVYTSHGPTIIMPTWFCHRNLYEKVGGFSEEGKGTPEDLIFFYKHLDLNGNIFRNNECLLNYYYHENAATFTIHEDTIWKIRLEQLEKNVLKNWENFTIWNAGKQGRKMYNSLSDSNKKKVIALCDVDINKIDKKYKPYDPKKRKVTSSIDIIHFKKAKPPFVICVKLDMTDGLFEQNLKSLNLIEGKDYIHFG